jgi:hypothetical protein
VRLGTDVLCFDDARFAGSGGKRAVKGRIWLIIGIAAGIAIGIGKLPYLAGAAQSLADTSQRVVGSAELTLIHHVAGHGASRRVVEGLAAIAAVLIPGLTAIVLILAARGTLRVRLVIVVLLVALGASAFISLPKGHAAGVAVLAFVAAGVVLIATGPLVVAPLAALASLIGTTYLPRLVSSHSTIPNAPVVELHRALFADPSSPTWLRIVVLLVAAAPFALAARLALR